jgi:predicted TIM-barrel fold metal-dependent hydrolase
MPVPSRNADWLALTQEEALDPSLPICDPHHHFWDGRDGTLTPRYMLDELLLDTGSGHNIVSTVFIECASMYRTSGPEPLRPLGEVEFVNGIAAQSASGIYGKTQAAAGIIGTVDLMWGEAAGALLDAELTAGGGRFRGIRRAVASDPSPEVANHRTNPPERLFERDDFRYGFANLGPRNLSFEAWCYHPQIPQVTALAREFPDTTIILNHFGGPLGIGPYAGKQQEVFADWRASMTELATCPNVVVKLGGLNMELNGFAWHEKPRPPTGEELAAATRHYFDFTIEKFGADRCMFESNFPVDKLSCSYVVLWNSFKRIASGCSTSERAALFHDTATRVYRLDD